MIMRNYLINEYLNKYGIKDDSEWSEEKKYKMANDDSFFYRITDDLQGWYIKERTPNDAMEDLVIGYLKNLDSY